MVALSAGASWAAHPHHRGGFFLGFNLGGGTADVNVENADTDREWGGAGNLRIGGAIRNNLLLGAETSGWARNEGNETVTLSTICFAVTYYPGDQGFFLRGGMGFAGTSLEIDLGDDTTQSKSETGFGILAAMGYEWRLTGKFALGPQVEFNYLNIGGDLVDTANFFDATLGFNWYW
jgi:hypothetical protein